MREILFRGKGTHGLNAGDWIYGYYVKDFWRPTRGGHGILPIDEKRGGYCEVDPETVGQYTGLTDKNGRKIFEGDIVRAVIHRCYGSNPEWREEIRIVGYDNLGMLGLKDIENVWSDFMYELDLSGGIEEFSFEAIGNIHDNPELLKGGAE